jgi:hypothetical protein
MSLLPVNRPDGTLDAAITARDFEATAQWARYFDYEDKIHMFTLNSVCRGVEEIGYVLSGKRYEEAESVWNVVAHIARERGDGALVDEVLASYET